MLMPVRKHTKHHLLNLLVLSCKYTSLWANISFQSQYTLQAQYTLLLTLYYKVKDVCKYKKTATQHWKNFQNTGGEVLLCSCFRTTQESPEFRALSVFLQKVTISSTMTMTPRLYTDTIRHCLLPTNLQLYSLGTCTVIAHQFTDGKETQHDTPGE